MSDKEEFLGWAGSRLRDAEEAMHNGDAAPRLAIWSERDPVTVFGAVKSATGQEEVRELFRFLETRFSDCGSYSYEIVAAQVVGDMADLSPREWRVEGRASPRGRSPEGRGVVGQRDPQVVDGSADLRREQIEVERDR